MSHLFFVVADDFFIQPLTPNLLIVKYLQPVTLSFQVAVQSNGIFNRAEVLLERPGPSEQTPIFSTRDNSQVFTEELGPAGIRTVGNYTACEHITTSICVIVHNSLYFNIAFMFENLFGNSTVEVFVESKLLYT